MKKIVLSIGLILLLAGCGNEVVKCDTGGDQLKVTYELEVDGDKVVSNKTIKSIDLEAIQWDDVIAKEVVKNYEELYNSKGVKYTYELKDKKLKDEVVFDFDKIDEKDLAKFGFTTTKDKDGKSYVSYKDIKENIVSIGGSCKDSK